MISQPGRLTFGLVVVNAPWWRIGEVTKLAAEHGGFEMELRSFGNEGEQQRQIDSGKAQFGVNARQMVHWAYRGIGPYAGDKRENLRAVAAVDQPRWLGLAVRRATGLRSLRDIAEKKYPLRVYTYRGTDVTGSMAWTLENVLGAHGVTYNAIESWGGRVLTFQNGGANAVADGNYDAILGQVYPAYGPVGRLWQLTTNRDDMFFLPIDNGVMEDMRDKYDLRPGVMPAGYLKGIDVDTPTFFFRSHVIYTHANLDDEIVYKVTEGLNARNDQFLQQYVHIGYNPFSACRDTGAPLHAGAEKYYRDNGFLDE